MNTMSKKIINAKFNSRCAATGCRIMKGERMMYNYETKKCYGIGTTEAAEVINGTSDVESTKQMIEAQEEAYYDNFCMNNGI